jgi:hypothetical protein
MFWFEFTRKDPIMSLHNFEITSKLFSHFLWFAQSTKHENWFAPFTRNHTTKHESGSLHSLLLSKPNTKLGSLQLDNQTLRWMGWPGKIWLAPTHAVWTLNQTHPRLSITSANSKYDVRFIILLSLIQPIAKNSCYSSWRLSNKSHMNNMP